MRTTVTAVADRNESQVDSEILLDQLASALAAVNSAYVGLAEVCAGRPAVVPVLASMREGLGALEHGLDQLPEAIAWTPAPPGPWRVAPRTLWERMRVLGDRWVELEPPPRADGVPLPLLPPLVARRCALRGRLWTLVAVFGGDGEQAEALMLGQVGLSRPFQDYGAGVATLVEFDQAARWADLLADRVVATVDASSDVGRAEHFCARAALDELLGHCSGLTLGPPLPVAQPPYPRDTGFEPFWVLP